MRKTHIFIVIFLLSLFLFFPLQPQTQQQASDFEKQLSKLLEEIKELKAKISQEEKKKTTILSQLDEIHFKKNLIRNEISLYELQMKKTNSELAVLRKKIPELRKKMETEKEAIKKIFVTMYKFGRFETLQFVLQAETMESLLTERKNLTILARHEKNILSSYLKSFNELQAAAQEWEAKKGELSRLMASAALKRKDLEGEEEKQKTLLKKIETNRKMYSQALEELKGRAEELHLLIKKLEMQEWTFPLPFVPLYEKKGKLPWPLEGKIITSFGLQRHPQFNTITQNNGIEISPAKNKLVVKAVHPGKVVYADYFQGYGNLIILDHGMSYYTLYGHCSEFLVQKGDLVNAGQPIAIVGEAGSLKGISLYFELRFKTRPLNPLQWLQKR